MLAALTALPLTGSIRESEMSSLSQALEALLAASQGGDLQEISEADRDFIELVTFADASEILETVRQSLADDWMGMPVWARNLAYRLACLQRPDDPDLLREAAADLISFGPDWDHIANDLRARAEALDSEKL